MEEKTTKEGEIRRSSCDPFGVVFISGVPLRIREDYCQRILAYHGILLLQFSFICPHGETVYKQH